MKSIIDCFDRAYIINLIDRTDRRQDVVKEFQRIGIEVPNPKVHFHTAIRPVDKGNFCHPGERGCFQSHKQILEFALWDGLKNVLIFEDDVGFRRVDTTALRDALVSLSCRDWDVIYFGY